MNYLNYQRLVFATGEGVLPLLIRRGEISTCPSALSPNVAPVSIAAQAFAPSKSERSWPDASAADERRELTKGESDGRALVRLKHECSMQLCREEVGESQA